MYRAPTRSAFDYLLDIIKFVLIDGNPGHRRSIRLARRDYSWPGTYFGTICTAGRKCLLGGIEDGVMRENVLGRLVRAHWCRIPSHFAAPELDAFVVMPSHFHGLIHLHRLVEAEEQQYKLAQFGQTQSQSIAAIIGTFKAAVTRDARRVLHRPKLIVWQRNYFERVIRDGKEYEEVCRYIGDNPSNWKKGENSMWGRKPEAHRV